MFDNKVKFLIIRFSSIGDIVLTTPVIRCLKQQVENVEVHYLTKPQFASILKHNPYIDKLHILKEDQNETIQELKAENFNYIIDLHHNIRTYRIKQKLKTISFSFHKLNIKKWLLVNFKINKLPEIHIVDRYLKTLSVFDVGNDDKGLDYFISEEDKVEIKNLPADFQNGYVALVIGAKHETKKLPENKLVELVNKINRPIIILGGKEDYENGEKLISENSLILNT
jgi:ADP-heptose:LPS heptosyltransferase